MIRVKATREGLLGKETASGYIVDTHVAYVSLPNEAALHGFVHLWNPLNGNDCYAQVLDVGPYNLNDPYVFQPSTEAGSAILSDAIRPLSESGVSISGDGTNGSGIDLGEWAWNALGMTDNTDVCWAFLPQIVNEDAIE